MQTPGEIVEELGARDATTLTRAEKSALNSARYAIEKEQAAAALAATRARASKSKPPACPSTEPTAVLLWALMHNLTESPDTRIRATMGFWKIQEEARAQGGNVPHVVTFKGGVDGIPQVRAETPTAEWITHTDTMLLEELVGRIQGELAKRASKPS